MRISFPSLNTLFGVLLIFAGCDQTSKYAELDPFYGPLAQGDSLVHPAPQYASHRQFEGLAIEKKLTLSVPPGKATDETPPELIMKWPIHIAIDPEEEFIYVMDKETFRINKMSLKDGALVQSITAVQEYKKGNNSAPMIQYLIDGTVNVFVPGKKVLTLEPSGEVKEILKHPRKVNSYIIPIDADSYVGMTVLNYPELFHVYNKRGRRTQSFGFLANLHLLEKPEKMEPIGHMLDFMGTLGTDGKSSFVYSGSLKGGLLGFSKEGTLRFYRETINHRPYPQKALTDQNKDLSPADGEASNSGLSTLNVWNEVYYQHVIPPCTAESCPQTFTVDAYSYENGDYLYSLNPPANCFAVFLTDSHLYANCPSRGLIQFIRPERPQNQLIVER